MAGLISLTRSTESFSSTREGSTDVVLIRMDPRTEELLKPSLRLQYYPDTITDSKQVNYQTREVPGASLPLYQFINGGERLISFTVHLAADLDVDSSDLDALDSKGLSRRNSHILASLIFLRSCMHPFYEGTGSDTLTYPPPKVLLKFTGEERLDLLGGVASNSPQDGAIITHLVSADIEFSAFFPSGRPRRVDVSVSFAQEAGYQDTVVFPSYDIELDNLLKSNGISLTGVLG